MTAVPIPAHEVKRHTWYYGVRCACDRLHALCEDLFAGKTDEQHFHFAVSLAVECECGKVIRTHLLQKML